ncbi:hypothetical protein ACJX0J_022234 [Zea mays]
MDNVLHPHVTQKKFLSKLRQIEEDPEGAGTAHFFLIEKGEYDLASIVFPSHVWQLPERFVKIVCRKLRITIDPFVAYILFIAGFHNFLPLYLHFRFPPF